MRQSLTPTAVKSSKESFQHFRKAAIEKEEREKALKKRQFEENRESEAPEKTRYSHINSNCNKCVSEFFFIQFLKLKLLPSQKDTKTTLHDSVFKS